MLFNRDRATAMMAQCDVDVLIATSPVNVTYFSDYSCWIDPLFKDYMMSPGASSRRAPMYAASDCSGGSCLVVNPIMAANGVETWVDDLVAYGASSWDLTDLPGELAPPDRRLLESLERYGGAESGTEGLLQWLRQCGLEAASIGIEMEGLRPDSEAEIRGALSKARIRDASDLIRMIRMVKTGEEIAHLRSAARISEAAGMATLERVRPGVRVLELVACYREQIACRGADFDHYAYGVRGTGLVTRVDMTLNAGDHMYIDYGCIYEGYFSDTGFTLAVQEAGAAVCEQYQLLREAHAAGVEQIRPGAASSGPAVAMQEVLAAGGFPDTFPHGHGLGLEVRDYPIIVPRNGLRIADECIDLPSDLPFEENMVVNLEAGTFLFGRGSTQYEQSVLVTGNGCEPLVPHDRSQVFVGG